MDAKVRSHVLQCAVVVAEQGLVAQYFVAVQAILPAEMNRQWLLSKNKSSDLSTNQKRTRMSFP